MPQYDSKTPAVVLLTEMGIQIDKPGEIQTTTRHAVRILTREGRVHAAARALYQTDTGKVRQLRAWMIFPSGRVKSYGKKETIDVALTQNDVYNEVRIRVIPASADADPGAIFGFESIVEERSVFVQFGWQFQTHLPTLISRLTLSLPRGWRAQSVTYNHTPIAPNISGRSYIWELRDLPFIELEEDSPGITSIAPRVAVSCFPPAEAKATMVQTFDDWTDVSRWLSGLNDPQAQPNDSISARAEALAANANNEFERIEAIGRYVQKINYISIQTGLGRGGGYRPHAAADVFQKSYGDCKDKVNLMRTMLSVLGIESYPVAIFSGDRYFVRPNFASPQQFNHAIIGIKVSQETAAPAMGQHPTLGRLLFFDPTDPYTPAGYLPDQEQGSLALVVAGEAGALVRMPAAEAAANRLERNVDVKLNEDGSIAATVRERCFGQSAVRNRSVF